jgi:hypothetical protein
MRRTDTLPPISFFSHSKLPPHELEVSLKSPEWHPMLAAQTKQRLEEQQHG